MRTENGTDYVMFPWYNGRSSGYVKMSPRGFKRRSKSISKVVSAFLMFGLIFLHRGKNFERTHPIRVKINHNLEYSNLIFV